MTLIVVLSAAQESPFQIRWVDVPGDVRPWNRCARNAVSRDFGSATASVIRLLPGMPGSNYHVDSRRDVLPRKMQRI